MSKYGAGYQIEGLRRKLGMEKTEKTLDSQIKCPFEIRYICTKDPFPLDEYITRFNKKSSESS